MKEEITHLSEKLKRSKTVFAFFGHKNVFHCPPSLALAKEKGRPKKRR